MATTIINQQSKEGVIVAQSVITTAGVHTGLAYDGAFLWLCGSSSSLFEQLSMSPIVPVRSVSYTGGVGADEMCFDGENFWAAMNANNGIGHFTREGQRTNFVGGITATTLEGICHDGEYLWACCFDALGGGGSRVVQVDHTSGSGFNIVSSFTITPRFFGLVFDGEFLVGKASGGGGSTVELHYFTRTGQLVKTVSTGPLGGSNTMGLTYDGEYFYWMVISV